MALGSSDTKFSAALGSDKRIAVTGAVKGAQPYLTRIGTFDVDLALRGNILLVRGNPPTGTPPGFLACATSAADLRVGQRSRRSYRCCRRRAC